MITAARSALSSPFIEITNTIDLSGAHLAITLFVSICYFWFKGVRGIGNFDCKF